MKHDCCCCMTDGCWLLCNIIVIISHILCLIIFPIIFVQNISFATFMFIMMTIKLSDAVIDEEERIKDLDEEELIKDLFNIENINN